MMPPKCKFTKEEIIRAALDITRESGMEELTARALAARLDCSVKPIFGHFDSMETIRSEVLAAAQSLYQSYVENGMSDGKYPPYKASGMAYIRFAKEEKALFRLLFMRDRSGETPQKEMREIQPLLELIQKNTGLNAEDAYIFHLEMWLYVHGIATMIATAYLDWDMAFVSRALTDGYIGLKERYSRKEKENGSR